MNKKLKNVLASYIRSFLVAIATAYSMGATEPQDILIAGLIAVAGPAIRAIDKNDNSFGIVADVVDVELKKLAKRSAKKK